MAENSLLSALNLQFAPSDTEWGLAQSVLAQTAPKLISDYRSTGANLGIGLGSILMSALLGYQAQSQATRRSLLAQELANKMQSEATTPEARVDFLKRLSEQGEVSSDVVGKLSTLSSALTSQDRLTALEDVKRQKTAQMEAYAKMAAEQGIDVTDLPEWLKRRRAALGGQPSAIGVEGTPITGATGAPVSPDLMTADERKQLAERQRQNNQAIEDSRKQIQADPVYKEMQEIRKNANSAFSAYQKATKDPESARALDQLLIKTAERVSNPGNQITLEEYKRGDIQPMFEKLLNNARSTISGGGFLSDDARRQILSTIEMAAEASADAYNSRVRSEMEYLGRRGIKEATPSLIGPSRLFFTTKESGAIQQRLDKLNTIIQSDQTSAEDKQRALTIKTQVENELKRKQDYYESDVFKLLRAR